ncbi:outer membrane protein assembly factor BamA [Zavarzinia sp. CC-PAN008]|uniref:outer membrane protein assembly factor BamA n=1 Tax=Zavarzinia sp. CC-PAN008 TaxID=3243332 RepID=UPI003F745B0C
MVLRLVRTAVLVSSLTSVAAVTAAQAQAPDATGLGNMGGGYTGGTAISAITVEGNQRIEDATVRSYMELKPGDTVDAARVDDAIKALYATGLFGDVRIRTEGGTMIVSVVENPVINRIAFEGNDDLSDSALEKETQLRPRVIYTRSKVQADVQRLIELYRRSGRFAAAVEPKVVQLPQNRIDLIFEIDEGPKTGIARINFVGNKIYDDGDLREVITTRETAWWRFFSSSDSYDPDRLTYDREMLRKYYLARGYADFRVVSAVAELTRDRQDFIITFTVDEGEQYTFGKIDVDSRLPDVKAEEMQPLLRTVEGDTYNADLIDKTIDDLTFQAGRLGYAFVEIRPRVRRDREQRLISLTYEIEEAPRVYVERIDIAGNTRTLDRVIRREFRLVEGDAFNTAKLERSKQRLNSLGFFEKVNVTQVEGSAPDRTIVNVEVQEKSTGELSLGAGYSTSESVVGDIAIRERNLLGRGQDLRLGLSLSSRRSQIDLSFTEPYFLDRNIAAGFDIYNINRDLQDEAQYDQKVLGFGLRAGFPLSEYTRLLLRYTIRQDTIDNVGPFASRVVREAEGTEVTSSIGYQIGYDERDSSVNPTRGYNAAFGQDFAGIGGTVTYLRAQANAGYYYPFLDDVIGSIKAEVGYIWGLGEDVRLNDRFYVGGNNMRGFERGGIGPRDITTTDSLGGNLYFVGSAEVTFPLGLPSEYGIKAAAFTDFGTLTEIDSTIATVRDSGLIRISAGVGVSWDSPFGPVRVDLGQAILKEDYDKTQFFRFNFGTRF